jgi:hypothetical protein
MYSGPHISKSGLIFAYDTGEFPSTNPNFDKFRPHNRKGQKPGRGLSRFYRGRPSINYVAHQNAVAQDTYTSYSATSSGNWNANHPNAIRAYNAQGGDITGYYNGGVGNAANTHHAHWQVDPILKKPVVVMNAVDSQWKAKSYGMGMSAWSSYGLSHGDKYVISWLQWTNHLSCHADAGVYSKNTAGNNNFWDGRSGNAVTAKNTVVGKWQRVYKVFTISTNRDLSNSYGSIYMYGQGYNSAGRQFRIADVQLEIDTDAPSAFMDHTSSGTTSSRNSTSVLMDMTKNHTIDTANVSFNSNGHINFDGTDDYISLAANPQYAQTSASWEFVVKFDVTHDDDTSTYRQLYIQESSIWIAQYYDKIGIDIAKDNGSWFDGNGGRNTSSQTGVVDANTWYHVIFTFNNGVIKGYLNGALQFTTTISGMTGGIKNGSNTRNIGRRSGNYLDGSLPIVRLYNSELAADQVSLNYKSYKARFDF